MAKLCQPARHYVATSALLLPRSFRIISAMEKIKPYELTEEEQKEYQEYEKDMQDQFLEDVAENLANACLRARPTLPAHPANALVSLTEAEVLGELPVVHCAFKDCSWHAYLSDMPVDRGEHNTPELEQQFRTDADHPFEQKLKRHILEIHFKEIVSNSQGLPADFSLREYAWDIYKAAISVLERRATPISGVFVDRRAFQTLGYVFNDERTRRSDGFPVSVLFKCPQPVSDHNTIPKSSNLEPELVTTYKSKTTMSGS